MMSAQALDAAGQGGSTELAGIVIPSTSTPFLAVVAVHVLVALVAVVAGAAAMILRKGTRRHHQAGTIYFWALVFVAALALILSAMRWPENAPLAALGILAFVSAFIGRRARRRRWLTWRPLHIAGMGGSYIFMLTAFYVDNGRNLPLWRDLPEIAYWIVPALIGTPIILWATARHRANRSIFP